MTSHRSALAGLVSAAAFVGASYFSAVQTTAQSPRDGAGAQTPSSAARLSGRVVDATNGSQPIRRAIVTLTGDQFAAGRSSISDDDGRFTFEGLPAGTFTLTATRPGFLRSTYGALRAGRPGTPIRVRDGQPLADVTLTMTHGSAIEGQLRDPANDAAPGMRVEAIRLTHGSAGDHAEVLGTAFTDDRGVYRIFGLPAGDYVLAATPALIVGGMGDIGVPTEAEVDALLAAVERRSSAPPPPPGAPPPAPIPPVKGFSTPATFYPGVVQSGTATRVTLGANDDRQGLDFGVQMSHAASIDGTIVPVAGQSVPQILIRLLGGGPQLPVAGGGMSAGPSLSTNPADHTFRFSNVPPGRYTIMARTIGGPGNPTTAISGGGALPRFDASAGVQWALTDVEIGSGDMSDVSLALHAALKVTGRMAFDATSGQAPVDPSSIRLALEPVATDERLSGLNGALTGVVHSDGTFEFPAVLPGTFRLTASAGNWWARSAMLDGHDALDASVNIGTSDVGGMVVTLSDRHTAIAGSLSGTTGHAAPDYFMVAFPTDRALWRAPSRRVRSTRPATDGSFELRDLPPGTYHLAALTDVDPADLEDPDFLDSLVSASVTVTLEEGQRTTKNVRIGG